jgi:POT family proton-dependent oligopeptide transporter
MGEAPENGNAPVKTSHPRAIWFFFWGEFAERSSYYGMRAILLLYMTSALRYAVVDATPIYSAFKMACYFLPLLGGYVADRWLGRYWTIVGFSVPYVIGQFLLTIPGDGSQSIMGFPADRFMLFGALVLLAGGSGVIKPNISTLMGQTYDQKRPGQERLRSSAFLWFYLSINIGALISQFWLPEIRNDYIKAHLSPAVAEQAAKLEAEGGDVSTLASEGVIKEAYATAFRLPAWLMVGALVVFALGKKTYAVEKIEHHELTPEQRKLQWQTLTRLFGIFGLVVLFWFGYEHNDTLWVAFNRDYVDLKVPIINRTISPDQLQWLNALFVIILIPTFNFIYARYDPDMKIFTAMRKVLAGFLLTAAAVGIMSLAGFLAQGHTEIINQGGKSVEVSTVKVSVWWPAFAYVVLTFGEVLLYGTMLDLAYAAAPKSMKGFVSACFLVTNTLGNFINMWWTTKYGGSLADAANQRGSLLPGQFFGITAGVVFFAAIMFVVVGKKFERSQAEAAAAGLT